MVISLSDTKLVTRNTEESGTESVTYKVELNGKATTTPF
jgi:hypothetical protein